jgi:hypothetical protein
MEVKKKGAIIFWGLTRGLKHSIENLRSHLFDVLKENNIDYDIFIHTWYFKGNYENKWHKIKSIKLDFEEYKLLNAKYVIVEDQDKVQENFNFKQYQSQGDYFKNNFQSFNYYILSLISQKKITEKFKEKKDEYDFVIFQRPDILYKKKFNINWLNLINDNNIIVPIFGSSPGNNCYEINDRWCLCNSDNAVKYGTILNHILDYSKNNIVNAEIYLGWIMSNFYKIDIKKINMIFYRITPHGKIVLDDIYLIPWQQEKQVNLDEPIQAKRNFDPVRRRVTQRSLRLQKLGLYHYL